MSNENSNASKSNRDKKGRFVPGVNASPATQFQKGKHWRKQQPFRDKEWLTEQYVNQQRSTGDIAKEFGVTDAAILFWLRKHQIPRRDVSQARQIKKWGLSGKSNGMYGRCGTQNPRWIDGSSPERQRIYVRSFWKELIKAVYSRDNYQCQRCGAKHTAQNRLHAHHIKPWAGNPDFRFDLENIITLCSDCHHWVHSKENINNEYLSS